MIRTCVSIVFIFSNHLSSSLCKIVGTYISMDERVSTWTKQGLSSRDVDMRRGRSLVVTRLAGGVAFDAVSSLDLSDCALTAVDISFLKNLRALSVRNNRFSDVTSIVGLDVLDFLSVNLTVCGNV